MISFFILWGVTLLALELVVYNKLLQEQRTLLHQEREDIRFFFPYDEEGGEEEDQSIDPFIDPFWRDSANSGPIKGYWAD